MTTKEEVLRLLSDCGYCSGYVYRILVDGKMTGKFTDFIDKLIELAKQAGAAEELERCRADCKSVEHAYWSSLDTDDNEFGNGKFITFLSGVKMCDEAIRNRESKS